MTEQSILAELRDEIDRTAHWGLTSVANARLEALIRKYETDTVQDVSEQPGEWSIRGGNVEAVQHDGTYPGASHIRQWVAQRGGRSEWLGTYDQELDTRRIRLDSPRQPNIVNPGWWVVKTADGVFFTMPDNDFHIIYVPRKDV